MAGISKETIDQVNATVNILEVVSKYLHVNRRNKAIDAGIAAADEEPGAQIKNYGPYKKSKVASTPPKIWPNFDMFDEPNFAAAKGGRAMKSKGGRVTGAAKRGFGRALMKGKK